MRHQKLHYARPFTDKALCGKYLNSPGGHHLCVALREQDVTCANCLRQLAEPWHGTLGGYRNHRCKCDACTRANSQFQRATRDRLSRQEPPEHGANGYTNYRCRCDVCRAAHTAWRRAARQAERRAGVAGSAEVT